MANSAFLNLNNLVVDNIKSFTMIDSSTNKEIMNINTIPTDECIEERLDALDSFGNIVKSFYKTKQSGTNNLQVHPKAKICTQCGAVLHGNKCEYCGTEYR